jgi:mRNA interferase RelE/StbE
LAKFNVSISTSALNELYSLEKQIIERIKSALKELEEDPFRARAKADIKKLKRFREPEMFRLRAGDYRVIYTIEGKEVKVTHVIKRSAVYKGLE